MASQGPLKGPCFPMEIGEAIDTDRRCPPPQKHGDPQQLLYLWVCGLMETLITGLQYGTMCVGSSERRAA